MAFIRFVQIRYADGTTEDFIADAFRVVRGPHQFRFYRRQEYELNDDICYGSPRYHEPWHDLSEIEHSEPITNAPQRPLFFLVMTGVKPRFTWKPPKTHPGLTIVKNDDAWQHHKQCVLHEDDLDRAIMRSNQINEKWAERYAPHHYDADGSRKRLFVPQGVQMDQAAQRRKQKRSR